MKVTKVVILFLLVGLLAGYGLPKLAVRQVCPQHADAVVEAATVAAAPAVPTDRPPTVDEVRHFIVRMALEMKVDPQLALEIAESESKFRPHAFRIERNRTLSAGVFGLNQVLWKSVGVDDPWDWRANVIGGVGYIGRLAGRYGADGVKCRWVNGEWSRVCR